MKENTLKHGKCKQHQYTIILHLIHPPQSFTWVAHKNTPMTKTCHTPGRDAETGASLGAQISQWLMRLVEKATGRETQEHSIRSHQGMCSCVCRAHSVKSPPMTYNCMTSSSSKQQDKQTQTTRGTKSQWIEKVCAWEIYLRLDWTPLKPALQITMQHRLWVKP